MGAEGGPPEVLEAGVGLQRPGAPAGLLDVKAGLLELVGFDVGLRELLGAEAGLLSSRVGVSLVELHCWAPEPAF